MNLLFIGDPSPDRNKHWLRVKARRFAKSMAHENNQE
jgi:hypothetical protein